MKTIILTGGIGSGKSTVSDILRELGAVVIEGDSVGHEVVEPGTPGWQEVVAAFGRDILTRQQTIDRKKLAQAVFHNAEALNRLNGILHPRIDAEMETRLERYRKQGVKAVAIEVALITGAGWIKRADYIWVVKTPLETILKRLQDRDMSEAEARARMAFQPPVEQKLHRPISIIENDGTRDQLKARVEKLWQGISAAS